MLFRSQVQPTGGRRPVSHLLHSTGSHETAELREQKGDQSFQGTGGQPSDRSGQTGADQTEQDICEGRPLKCHLGIDEVLEGNRIKNIDLDLSLYSGWFIQLLVYSVLGLLSIYYVSKTAS